MGIWEGEKDKSYNKSSCITFIIKSIASKIHNKNLKDIYTIYSLVFCTFPGITMMAKLRYLTLFEIYTQLILSKFVFLFDV